MIDAVVCRTSAYEKRPHGSHCFLCLPESSLPRRMSSSSVTAPHRPSSPPSPPSPDVLVAGRRTRRRSPPALVSDFTHATAVACNCSSDSDGCSSGGDGPIARRRRSPSARSPLSKSNKKGVLVPAKLKNSCSTKIHRFQQKKSKTMVTKIMDVCSSKNQNGHNKKKLCLQQKKKMVPAKVLVVPANYESSSLGS